MRIYRWKKTPIFYGRLTEKNWNKIRKEWKADKVSFLYSQENTYKDVSGSADTWFRIPEDKLGEFLKECK